MSDDIVIGIDISGKEQSVGHVYVKRGATLVFLGEITAMSIWPDGVINMPAFVPAGSVASVLVNYPAGFNLFDPPTIQAAHRPKGPPPQPTGKGRLKRW